jgi:starvation-inducible DNA-binding protein
MKKSAPKTSTSKKLYRTENDIPARRRTELNVLMNRRLADAVDLQSQLKQAHWNVKGPSFIGLHELFDKIYGAVAGHVDLIAERIVQLGGIAEGTVLSEGLAHVHAVGHALATFGQKARQAIKAADQLDDADTADLFTEISRGIDQWLWFVEAHVQASK